MSKILFERLTIEEERNVTGGTTELPSESRTTSRETCKDTLSTGNIPLTFVPQQ